MTYLIGALVLGLCGVWLDRWQKRTRVSDRWLADQRRRESGRGVEQSCVKSWPIRREP